jgi:hypothetical protein
MKLSRTLKAFVVTSPTLIAEHITTLLPNVKAGTLKFCGVWFGRPMDNYHRITHASVKEDALDLMFDQGERLRIWEPGNFEIDPSHFMIQSASRVRWDWSYGAGGPYFHEYLRKGLQIEHTSNFHTLAGPEPRPTTLQPAVEIL